MRCSKCGAESKEQTKFCPECGKKFVPIEQPVAAGAEEGLYFCFKHKKEQTRVQCGRCERPICSKCMVMGPAGVRCKSCAKNRIAIRPRGVMHDLGSGATSPGAQRVWYMVIFLFVINLITGIFGGRRHM